MEAYTLDNYLNNVFLNEIQGKPAIYEDLKPIDKPEISRTKDERELIGAKWTPEEEQQLIEEFGNGMKISKIIFYNKKFQTSWNFF